MHEWYLQWRVPPAIFRELVPEPDVVSLRRVGHYPHFEVPGEVFRAWRDFCKTD